jgi:DNA-binding IclR family transcriptional regulator
MSEAPRRGIRSVEIAAQVLRALAGSPVAMPLSDLARVAGMTPSKVHRYLGSLINAGLVVQGPATARYDLGPFALDMGVAAIARRDPVNAAADALRGLALETGATAMLSVWSSQGATVVRWERAAGFLVTSLGLGSVLPLSGSATGNVFLAWLPHRLTAPMLEREGVLSAAAAEEAAARTRTRGYAAADGSFIPGLAAIAAPVLNWQGEADAAITLMAATATGHDLDAALPRLLATCRRLSRGSDRAAPFPSGA